MTQTLHRPLTFLLAFTLAVTAGITWSSRSDAAVPYPDAQRIEGGDAVSIGVSVSKATFADGGASAVVLGRADLFADTLSATGFAGVAKAPILFTPTGNLDAKVKVEIQRVLPSGRVYIMGGTAAISQKVEDQVKAMGYSVSRFRGQDRYQTAALTAKAILLSSTIKTVVLVRGKGNPDATQGWVDAVACGAWAADRGYPVLLTPPTGDLHPQTANVLTSEKVTTVHICGGKAAVSQQAEDQARAIATTVIRQSDSDRVGTAIKAAKNLWGYTDVTNKEFLIVPGFGDRFAWGVAASQLAAKRNAPLLLVDATKTTKCLSSDKGFQTLCYLASGGKIKGITAIGSTSIVSDGVLGAAAAAGKLAKDDNPPSRVADLGGSDQPQDDGTAVLLEFTASTDAEGADVSYDVYYRLPPEPEPEPTEEPTEEPTGEPTEEPTGEPTEEPTGEPTEEPTEEPVNPLTKESGTRATDVTMTTENVEGVDLVSLVVDLCDLAIPRDPETGEATSETPESECKDVEYEFIVIAKDSRGNEAAPSDTVAVAPVDNVPAAPAEAPTAEKASGGFTTVRWKVAPEADAAGYVIERSGWLTAIDPFLFPAECDSDWTVVTSQKWPDGKVKGRAVTSMTDEGSTPGETYCYRYRVFDTTANETENSPELMEYTA